MKIKYINHSIANRYHGLIEVNKNLKKYPELLDPILKHELAHSDEPFTLHDLKLDFLLDDKVNQWQLLKFMFKHPKSFIQISPILYSKEKGLIVDPNLLIMYSIMLVVFILTIYLGGKYL